MNLILLDKIQKNMFDESEFNKDPKSETPAVESAPEILPAPEITVEREPKREDPAEKARQIGELKEKIDEAFAIEPQDSQGQAKVERRQLKKGWRNRLSLVSGMTRLFFRAELSGEENLKEISEREPLIICPNHPDDYTLPIVLDKLGPYFPEIAVADASTHKSPFKNFAGFMGRVLSGWGNSFGIRFTGKKSAGQGVDGRGEFDTEDYEPMKKFLTSGSERELSERALVAAAYYDPAYPDKDTGKLPNRRSLAAAWLAISTGRALVP